TKEDGRLFKVTAKEENGLRELLCFAITGGYIQAWLSAPIATSAPLNDLKFLERLQKYSKINKGVADGAIQKLLGHLWYLSEELISLAFFDPLVPLDEKRAMLQALKEVKGSEDPPKRIKLQLSDLGVTRKPSAFITQQTKGFFNALGLPKGFLHKDPEVWLQDSDYEAAQKIVKGLKVVNDTAEKDVALIQEFNDHLTHNEEQKQFLLHIVSQHRKLCPNSKKSTVIST
uniref:Uncharacterized protein n=1 Tax=Latimeria chalumnae TaxID=7897 RepID=H3AY42_LATCH